MERIVFLNGEFVPEKDAKISVFDRGFMFADGIYEVVRFYDGKLFATQLHLDRLKKSLSEIQLSDGQLDWKSIFETLISRNNLTSETGMVYLQVTRGIADRDHPFPDGEILPTCFAYAKEFPRPIEKFRNGVHVIATADERWTRCDIKSISLLPNILAQQKAKEAKVQEAVLVKNGIVTEGSRSNFFIVKNGTLFTHPKTQAILPGVQREIVLQLAKKLELPVIEEAYTLETFLQADEIFISSTTSEIMPVIQVDDATIGSGKPGKVTSQLQVSFENLILAN